MEKKDTVASATVEMFLCLSSEKEIPQSGFMLSLNDCAIQEKYLELLHGHGIQCDERYLWGSINRRYAMDAIV